MSTLHATIRRMQATGRVVVPGGLPLQSGATHLLVAHSGEPIILLRSRRVTLEMYERRVVQVIGSLRGQVHGEIAPVFDVERAVRLPLIPGPGGMSYPGGIVQVELPGEATAHPW